MKTTLKKKLFGLSLSLFVAVIAIGIASCSSTKQVVNNAPSVPKVQKAEPINLILDADFGSSTDDLFALMMINHFMDEGRVDLKGIIVDREGAKNAGVVDIFNTYYGHPNVPVGLERNGVKNPRCFIPYNGICDLKDVHGNPMFKRSFDENKCMEGYKLSQTAQRGKRQVYHGGGYWFHDHHSTTFRVGSRRIFQRERRRPLRQEGKGGIYTIRPFRGWRQSFRL